MKRILTLSFLSILIFLILYFNCDSIDFLSRFDSLDIVSIDCFENSYTATLENVDYWKLIDLFDVDIYKSSEISGRLVMEGYSSMLKNYCVVDGLKTNMQISVCDDIVVIGYPLIKGSF